MFHEGLFVVDRRADPASHRQSDSVARNGKTTVWEGGTKVQKHGNVVLIYKLSFLVETQRCSVSCTLDFGCFGWLDVRWGMRWLKVVHWLYKIEVPGSDRTRSGHPPSKREIKNSVCGEWIRVRRRHPAPYKEINNAPSAFSFGDSIGGTGGGDEPGFAVVGWGGRGLSPSLLEATILHSSPQAGENCDCFAATAD